MSRLVSICLCAVMAFVAVAGVSLLRPAPVLAASGTLTMETPLHQSPDPSSPLIALMTEGTVVSIDGPPVDGFYPVTAGNLSGWMRGETLELAKDEIDESSEVSGTPDEASQSVPVEQQQDTGAEPLPGEDLAAEPATEDDPPVSDPALTGEAPVDPAGSDPPPETLPAATAETTLPDDVLLEPAPAEPGTSDPAATDPSSEDLTSEPAPEASAPEIVAEATVAPEPTPDPNVTPIPVAEAAPTGPASAAVDLPILLGPGPDYGLISTVPMGSTVEQTGHMIDGYVSVQSGEVTGWAALDQLAPPGSVVTAPPATNTPEPVAADILATEDAEATTEPTAESTETPTPEPTPEPTPVGPASVVVDMPIRSGPGPDYGLIFTVPLGSTVEQTGDLVDGYVSVQYKEVVGWAAREDLAPPIAMVDETPEETAESVDTKTPKPGSGVAYATVDLSLRAGPSANEEPIVVVPAGSRVVLTGVMEGDFQRVTFKDDIGWIANEYLATPEDPEPDEGGGRQESYSERQITRIIYQAADRYDQPRNDMLRVARCESNLDPYAVNPSGSYGLFQFIRSTWKSTPYGDDDIFDPQANANAAAWMWSQGRKSEWVCQ